MYRLLTDLAKLNKGADKLLGIQPGLASLSADNQKLISEIVLLRIFDLLLNAFKSMSCKVACGAIYLDGNPPILLHTCTSMPNATTQMRQLSRLKARTLRWTKASAVTENLRFIVDRNDNFMQIIRNHGGFIDEMRRVRNRIVHNNRSSRQNYQIIVRRYYGANLNAITPGTLLLSPRRQPVLLQRYLLKSKILVKELVKG